MQTVCQRVKPFCQCAWCVRRLRLYSYLQGAQRSVGRYMRAKHSSDGEPLLGMVHAVDHKRHVVHGSLWMGDPQVLSVP